MRQIILDTETTGLNPKTGDRVIEVGCVEMLSRNLTGNNLHFYINPERDSDPEALRVHGLTTEFLRDKPKFAEVAQELAAFLEGAEIIIHNAPFDVGFLDAEFARLNMLPMKQICGRIVDSLAMAKEMFPGKRNSLDALCERLGVSNAHRTLHGALLDAEILAEVYLAMTRGQNSLMMEDDAGGSDNAQDGQDLLPLAPLVLKSASEQEEADHENLLAGLDKQLKKPCIWRGPAPDPAPAA
ncbi:DNA polymerase III subunit epsilon [Massilia sp. W12]|uniref:DNA polymerase III subunit epsilon n=1 Tax=Massilia sp. W12 TaxID=3126507 RepID=UPI0030CBE353